MNEQAAQMARAKGLRHCMCGRSGVRHLPPAYYLSELFLADSVVPHQARIPCALSSSPSDLN